ncbi:MAG TPA: HlyD family secretion protein [Rhizomicrobium sp.]|jgi:RND family efflux transporter MFP subunit
MNRHVQKGLRMLVTLLIMMAAGYGAWWLWVRYNRDPWTRDGRLRADVVLVSPDINGLVTTVSVRDGQTVRIGDTLFVIDRPRYELALAQANAAIAADEAQLAQARREARRNRTLSNLVTTEQTEETDAKVLGFEAQLDGAKVARDTARLNLDRTIIRSTVNGIVTNLELQPGDYAVVGRQVMAVVNTDSIYADGYFEETKLPSIQVGDKALVHLMGVDTDLHGTVESVAAGIEDRERGASGNALANINPTFSWVRLAQRIPVRVRLEDVPPDIRLIAGRTATVSILVPKGRKREGFRSERQGI